MTVLMNGHAVAQKIKEDLAEKVSVRLRHNQRRPHLAAVLVGTEEASEIYVQNKVNDCKMVGFSSSVHRFSLEVTQDELLNCLNKLNKAPEVDGIIVQLPLPPHVQKDRVINAIDPNKDVDGFHHINFGKLCAGQPHFLPATPYGIMELLRHYRIETKGMHAVVVGRSYIVGLPTSILLGLRASPGNATVTLTHIHTRNLSSFTRSADLLVTAVGHPTLITADMVREGCVVVDVGITRVDDPTRTSKYTLKGDVDFDAVYPKASYITPVPRGVGPMTRAALLMNTLQAAERG